MSMIGIDPGETADALDARAEFAAAELMRQMEAQNSTLRLRLNAVLALCDQADAKGITSGGPFTVAAVRDAAAEK
ncbi:hypothetical protein ACF061_00760 [Streptomyces sp. NPDC015220]|uniref:hypothetical protein n=1 Tax=Streptomyces sp. NPDC015220 TaxID=3364947 RepID=UPI0036F57CB9